MSSFQKKLESAVTETFCKKIGSILYPQDKGLPGWSGRTPQVLQHIKTDVWDFNLIPPTMRSFFLPLFSSLLVLAAAENILITSKTVISKDGTPIYAEAAGNPHGPQVILAHGFACTHNAFDPLFYDPRMLATLYMVCVLLFVTFISMSRIYV